MRVIHVTAIQDGYTVVIADAHADEGPTTQCKTPIELRTVLRSLGSSDKGVAQVFKQLETSEDAELQLA